MWSAIKFFTEEEIECKCGCGMANINKLTMVMADRLRSYVGRPIHINSGCRCLKHNRAVGSKDTSSHVADESVPSTALDLSATTSRERFEIVEAALKAGFNRIGIAKSFVHVDTDVNKTEKVIWTY